MVIVKRLHLILRSHDFCIEAQAAEHSLWRSCPSERKTDGILVQACLTYRVKRETPFVFNVQAQNFTGQAISGGRRWIKRHRMFDRLQIGRFGATIVITIIVAGSPSRCWSCLAISIRCRSERPMRSIRQQTSSTRSAREPEPASV